MLSPSRLRAWLRERPLATDAVVAVAVFVFAVVVRPDQPGMPEPTAPTAPAVVAVAASCAALVVRRRFPVLVLGTTLAIGVVSVTVSSGLPQTMLPALVALFTVASWRDRRVTIVAAVVVAGALLVVVSSVVDQWTDGVYVLVASTAAAGAMGSAVRSRRAEVAAARDRAARAEQTREEEAQRRVAEERLRIARELHDVVAHHMAVISVQSGVAHHLADTQPATAREALGHVRESAEVVLTELSTILGLLRAPDEERPGAGPQTEPTPGLAQVDVLVDSMRRAGLDVTWRMSGAPVDLAPGTDVTAYRILQESLTNASKHGTGTAEVTMLRDPAEISIVVRNPVRPRAAGTAATSSPGGHGLVGMRERVTALGGRLDAGAEADGTFVVRVGLPVAVRDLAAPQPGHPAGAER